MGLANAQLHIERGEIGARHRCSGIEGPSGETLGCDNLVASIKKLKADLTLLGYLRKAQMSNKLDHIPYPSVRDSST